MPASDLIRWPDLTGAPDWLTHVEDAIDGALSSSNSVLNALLSPVRVFVHDVLHPVIGFADQIIGWAWAWVRWGWDQLAQLAGDAMQAADWIESEAAGFANWAYSTASAYAHDLWQDAVDYADRIVGDLARWAGEAIDALGRWTADAFDQLGRWAADAIDGLSSWTQAALDQLGRWASDAIAAARSEAAALWHDAIATAEQLAGDVRSFAADAIGAAEHLAARGLADLQQWASDALGILRRDVIDPLASSVDRIGHDFYGFLDAEWSWVKRAERWVRWVSDHVVQEAIDTWQAVKELDPASIFDGIGHLAAESPDTVWQHVGILVP